MHKLIRRIGLAGLLGIIPAAAMAQGKLVFDNTLSHAGEIVFQTPKQITFQFKNKGNQPIEITKVDPMCGCTEVGWTRGQILPGDKGSVNVTYDAKLMGTFNKEVAVYTTAEQEPIYLRLEGRVVAVKLDMEGDFPIDLGNVRMNTNYIEFDDVNRGDHPTAEIQIFNTERTPYRPELMHLPNYIKVRCVPEVIAGGRTGRVLVTLNSDKLNLMGLNQTRIYLSRFMGDKVSSKNEILVSSVLLPDFSKLTEAQLAQAPKMQLSTQTLDFADMRGKSKMKKSVIVTNNGLQPLTIRTVQVFNAAVGVSIGDRVLQPGKSTEMKITINTKYLKGEKGSPRVLIISNDPDHAKQTVNITL